MAMKRQEDTWIVRSPATGKRIGELEETALAHVPDLYRRAKDAFARWGKTTIRERVDLIKRLRLTLVEQMDQTARVIAEGTGKTEVEALTTEVLTVLDAIHYTEKHAARALRKKRMPTPIFLIGKTSHVEYMPRGVVLIISPWNFPFQLAMIPVISALAAGNTVILKPSEVTPLVGTLMESLFHKAGFPDDVVQVAHGGGELGAALVDAKPDFIFFTGSLRTGKIIQTEAAKHLIPTVMELSGKDPMIVFADAPLERAVHGALWGGFMNCGQVCIGVERVYVARGIYDAFTARLSEEVKRLKQGPQTDADVGSMTFQKQRDIVKEQVMDALTKGATLLAGTSPDSWDGMFIPPTVLADVTGEMKIAREETFGPVMTVIPFEGESEAIAMANASPYGLNASVWSKDTEKAERVASRLESGSVVINDVIISIANQHLPFGGVKQSGIGRYHGEIGLHTFSHEKAVMRTRLNQKREVNWFPYAGKSPLFSRLIQSYFQERRNWFSFLKSYAALLKRSR